MGIEPANHLQKVESPRYFLKVAVSLLHLRLTSGEVRTDKTKGRVVEGEADCHRAFVAGGSPHPRLDGRNRNFSKRENIRVCMESFVVFGDRN